MKIITEPSVHLLSVPMYFNHPEYELPDEKFPLEISSSSERLIATGGKVCYDSFGKDGRSIKEHINTLISSGHGSVLEHSHISLFIAGISRACSHEIVRHRHFSYSQRSTRYVKEEDAAIVLEPWMAENQNTVLVQSIITAAELALEVYKLTVKDLIELSPEHYTPRDKRKWARGKARNILPHALETRMVMTGNIRAWRDAIEARTNRHAEAEIRRLFSLIAETIVDVCPNCFSDCTSSSPVDGYPELTFKIRKV